MSEPIVIAATAAAGKPIVEKLFGKLSDLISKPVSLPFNCKSNVEDLKKKVAELEETKISMEESKQVAERRGEEVANGFQKWLNDAGNLIDAANEQVVKVDEEKAKNKCFYRFGGMCLYPVSRYKLSKKAEQNSVSIDQQISKASNYPLPIAHPPAPLREMDTGGKSFEEFPSRGRVLNQIMKELRGGTGVNRIGIHGMPGAGKTTLVEEVKRRLEEEEPDHGFVKVVLAKVTHKPDLKSIQEEIARGLGMDLLPVGDSFKQTADKIRANLSKEMEKGNVLVILDDIWAGIDLKEVGIPLKEADASGGNCEKLKILMTSRDCNVLEIQMSSQLNLPIGDLKYEEAWRLFEKIVGDKANDPELQPTAIGIVEECGGLPLAVATLANALKKGIPHEWRNALTKLKNPSPDNFTEVPKVVYTAIEFSYIQLKNEKLKRTFLLCCMMGRYASIEYLLRVGVGLGLFSRGNTIEDSRNELSTLIGDLKAASLLIGGSYDGCLDMHDLIHDVAIAIACKDHQGLLVSNNQELEELSDLEAVNGFKWVIMNLVDNSVLPYELEGPQLAFLHIHNQGSSLEIPENFFKRIDQRLKVLNLTRMHMSSSPSSPCFLENLHTLVLNQSVLGDMSIIGELKSLEILSLDLSEFEELPKEIAKLTRLKIFDLWGCRKLKVIPPHVLESLSRLEELYLPSSFQRWKLGEHENQENASLAELKHLEKLTTLEISIGNARMIPKDFLLGVNFYRICIGDFWYPSVHNSRTSLALKLDLSEYQCIESPIKLLLKNAVTELYLKDSSGVKKASGLQHFFDSSEGVHSNAFSELEYLFLDDLTKMEKIFRGRFEGTSFNKLKTINVSCCDQLKNLFSSSFTRQLLNLERLDLSDCCNIKKIVDEDEQASGNEIVETIEAVNPKLWEQLKILSLQGLPKLISFNTSCKSRPFFNDKVLIPNLEELELHYLNIRRIWHTTGFINASSFVENLAELTISYCNNLEYLFPSSMVKGLVKLRRLEISSCNQMKNVVVRENKEEMEKLIFPKLEFLEVMHLPKLVGFYIGNCSVEFPSLNTLSIDKCPNMKGFATKPTTTSTEDSADIHTLFTKQAKFPRLERLSIVNMKSLNKIWDNQLEDAFCKLSSLIITSCDFLQEIVGSPEHSVIQSYDPVSTQPTSDDDEVEDGIVFDKLNYLELYYLKNLRSFCSLKYKIAFPSLDKAIVAGCPRMQIFSVGESITPKLRKVDWTSDPNDEGSWKSDLNSTIQLMFIKKVGHSTLKSLDLAEFPELVAIWNERHQETLSFRMLTNLTACNISDLTYLFTPSMVLDLVLLRRLKVSNCDAMEQVITGKESQEIIFPNLKTLKLKNLPNLTKFCSESYLGFPKLELLSIVKCALLKTFVLSSEKDKDIHAPILALFDTKVRFPELERMAIDSLGNLSKIWEDQLDVEAFCKLQCVGVFSCEKLLSVFPLSMLERLQRLCELCIEDCSSLEEVLEFQGHGATQLQAWTTTNPTFVDVKYFTFKFPALEYLGLCLLPKLKFFFPQVHTIEFPLLTTLEVEGCDEVQIFAFECPSVQSMTGDNQIENLNPCPLFWVTKATFPCLKELILGWSDMFKEIWGS